MLKALWKAFVDSLVGNEENLASFKMHRLPNSIIKCKYHIYPIWDQNDQNTDFSIFD